MRCTLKFDEDRRKLQSAAEFALKAVKESICRLLVTSSAIEELNALYDEVQKDFSAFYCAINEER